MAARRAGERKETVSTAPSRGWIASLLQSVSGTTEDLRGTSPDPRAPVGTLSTTLLRFTHRLRDAGIPVSMVETLDSAEALRHVDVTNRGAFKAALATTLVKRVEHQRAFDSLFDIYFATRREDSEVRTSLDRVAGTDEDAESALRDDDEPVSTDLLRALL